MSKNERNVYTINERDGMGEVMIADEVVAVIAGLAAKEVDGVVSMAGHANRELSARLGMKKMSKGVGVHVMGQSVKVALTLNVRYNYSIPDVSKRVQEKVKNAIENMTGLTVTDVAVKVVGVEMDFSLSKKDKM